MARKKYFSLEQKLAILDETKRLSLNKVAKLYQIDAKTIRAWKLILKYQGIHGLSYSYKRHHYSESKKKALVKEFNSSSESALVFAAKHGIASDRSLREWVIRYNESKATVYTPRKRDSIMPGRKTTFEERLSIIEDLIKITVGL